MGRALRPHGRRANPAAQLRRSQVPAPGPRRRSHGARDDPHAAAARHPLGHEGVHGVHRDAPARRAGRGRSRAPHPRRLRLLARERALRHLPREVGRARHGRHRAGVPHQLQLVGVHRRRAGPRVPRRGGAHGHGVHAVSPDGDGLAAERARHAHHRGRARRGRDAAQQRRQAHHVRLHPRALRQRDGAGRARGRPVASREHLGGHVEGAAHAGPLAARHRRPRHPQRGEGRSRQPARRRVPRHFLAPHGRGHQAQAPGDVPPVQGAGRRRHHQGADGGRADGALHDGRHPRRSGDAAVAHRGALRRRRVRGGDARRQPARRQLAVGPARLRAHRRAPRGQVRQEPRSRVDRRGRDRGRRAGGAGALRASRGAEPVSAPRRSQGQDADPRRHHPHRGRPERMGLRSTSRASARRPRA